MLVENSARKEQQQDEKDCGGGENKADTIQHNRQDISVTLDRERFARRRGRRLVVHRGLLQNDAAAPCRAETETTAIAAAQKHSRQYVDERLQTTVILTTNLIKTQN